MWNKKGQFDFSEMEFNPIAAGMGLIGGCIVFAMMNNTGKVSLGLFWKIVGFLGATAACYFLANFILNRD